MSRYDFLVETYRTERLKTLSVWAQVPDERLLFRPEPRARTPLEHMVHQSVSEDVWMRTMLGVEIGHAPLPAIETKPGFLEQYAICSEARLAVLERQLDDWFEEQVRFFDVIRSRAWVLTRRFTHSAHHRGQLTAYFRVWGQVLYSTYGPTADTGGLFQNHAQVIYRFASVEDLLAVEPARDAGPALPGTGEAPVTERPDRQSSLREG